MMHTQYGAPRISSGALRSRGYGSALLRVAGTGAALAIADVLIEQQRQTDGKERAASGGSITLRRAAAGSLG